MTTVPKFDFTNYDFTLPLGVGGGVGGIATAMTNYSQYCYRGPGELVQRVATAVGAQGQVLPITPPSLNASWSLSFWGPSLQCSNVEGQGREDIWASVWEYLDNGTRCADSYGYLSWVPSAQTFVPFVNQSGSLVLQSNSLTIGAPAAFYVAAIPPMFSNSVNMPTHTLTGGCVSWDENRGRNYDDPLEDVKQWFNSSTLLQCQFFNTSFIANIDYIDGSQSINVSQPAPFESQPFEPVDCVTGPIAITNGGGEFEQAWSDEANRSCSTLNLVNKQCGFDPSLVRLLAYQSIADMFGYMVQGSIGLGGDSIPYPEVTFGSYIEQTVLLDT
jgi:hypothetical protein